MRSTGPEDGESTALGSAYLSLATTPHYPHEATDELPERCQEAIHMQCNCQRTGSDGVC